MHGARHIGPEAAPPQAGDPARDDAIVVTTVAPGRIRSGIAPLDERTGGLDEGGTYLVVGAPGPAKMVATLQFLHAGVSRGEHALLVTDADAQGVLAVASAWGFPLDAAWRDGTLQILGFRDDFSLRAMRSIAPGEVLEELDSLVVGQPTRIGVDPGSLFLMGGSRTLLGVAFVEWAKRRPATVLATFSIDGDPSQLPSTADWIVRATTARLLLERVSDGLLEITFSRSVPGEMGHEEKISLELRPGAGLVRTEGLPTRRGNDRAGVDERRLLLLSLGGSQATDLSTWAARAFESDLVTDPMEAVASVQSDRGRGCVLIHAPRSSVRQAVQACRVLRPLTRAAIVFASDDAIRSTDRVQLLEAGADDCLSGGLDFRELGVRIRQAITTGAKPAKPSADGQKAAARPHAQVGGRVGREVLAQEFARRAADPNQAFFCVLDVRAGEMSPTDLESTLAELVRSDEGDLVAALDTSCAVLLQGAREAQLAPLLGRIGASLTERSGKPGSVQVKVLSHPYDAPAIRELVGIAQ